MIGSNERIKLYMEFKKSCEECQTAIDELCMKLKHTKGVSLLSAVVLETSEGMKYLHFGEYDGGYILIEEYLNHKKEMALAVAELDKGNGSAELVDMFRESGFKDYKQEEVV